MFDVAAILGFFSRCFGSALSAAAPAAHRAWKRMRFKSAAPDRFSVLVARFAGDSTANTTQRSILDAIEEALPEMISIHAWPEHLQFPDGEDRAAQSIAHKTARKWLAQKRCDLLIAGRMKSATVIQLRFIPSAAPASGASDIVRPLSYAMPSETMDLPVKFINDLAASLGARIAPFLRNHRTSTHFMQRIEVLSNKLKALVDSSSDIGDPQTRAAVINSYATARAIIFEFRGRREDIEAALKGFDLAASILDAEQHSVELARTCHNYGAALASLGSSANDAGRLNEAIEVMKDTLSTADFTITNWAKAQAILAFAYLELSRLSGSTSALAASLDVCLQTLTPDVFDADPLVWAAVSELHGKALLMLSDTQSDCDALHRAVHAFTDALEVWDSNPIMKMSATVNLSRALIGLGIRHGKSAYFNDAIAKLEEIKRTVSKTDYARISQAVEINLGICRASLAENEPDALPSAIAALRQVQPTMASATDKQLSLRVGMALARALMLSGKLKDNAGDIEEGILLLGELANSNEPSLQRDAKHNLAVAYRFLGVLTEDLAHLELSRDLLSTLLQSTNRAEHTFAVVQMEQDLGVTLKQIGKVTQSDTSLEHAAAILRAGLDYMMKDETPFLWAAIHVRLADTYFELERLRPGTHSLDRAHEHIAEALSVLSPPANGPLSVEALQLAERIHDFTDGEPEQS